ncbi:hypothetical protein CDAR_39111 [Caerostris darwini]|uniref:Uncharacterized protein n=1 Tax=Caerostris darwini TaxID=1538125 RepID=A0AAV4URY8_9ARAC|nr:hypothetical protein CDAR_39111 [Caerostris darwini]
MDSVEPRGKTRQQTTKSILPFPPKSRCLRFLILNLLRKEIVVTPNTFPETNQTKINEIIQHLLGGIHIAFENRLRIQKNNFNRSYEA